MTHHTTSAKLGGNRTVLLAALFFLAGLAALVALFGALAQPAYAAVARVGPTSAATGFPVWYQDATRQRLELCLDGPPLCLTDRADLTAPEGEAFWWAAEADINRRGAPGGTAQLVLAAEAAFASNKADSQISFGRVRVRVDDLRPNTAYSVTYPYGVHTLRSNDLGVINFNRDIGCAGANCDFSRALNSEVFASFLRWDPNVGAAAPTGYLGNPNRPHAVVGSPNGTNFFRIEGPDAGGRGSGIDTVQTSRFFVQGKLR